MEMDPIILARISKEAGVGEVQTRATIALLEDQATVPFIARYRKEATGNLDEVVIRTIEERLEYYKDLLARRETILKTIEEQGKLTEELKGQILACYEKNELEDLYLPYKPKRKTKASVALEKGLEPLARFIWDQVPGEKSLEELAEAFVNPEKEVATREAALEGALHIVAEWISEDAEIRRKMREQMLQEGFVVAKVVKGKEEQKTKFEMYYDFKEPVSKIPSHRMLAIRRGVKEQVLNFNIEMDGEKACQVIAAHFLKEATSPFVPYWQAALRDSYERLLNPSIQGEVRASLKERSDEEAIEVFEANLTNLLLSPPAGAISVLGIDPGFRTGCKVAVVDETGKFLEHATIYPTEPKRNIAQAEKTLLDLIQKHQVQAIDIGNGTASRETDSFVKSFLRKYLAGVPLEFQKDTPSTAVGAKSPVPPETDLTDETAGTGIPLAESAVPSATTTDPASDPEAIAVEIPAETACGEAPTVEGTQGDSAPASAGKPASLFSVIVNESGASVYSASDVARKEFPDLDVTVRGAISIARRLQDPLAELVKIHPKSIGVGQYQHDVDQNRLREGLEATVESCVNRVGVDLNTASFELLRYVSGLNQRTARRIVEFRNQNGKFTSRVELMKVPGFGEKTFEQAAGFLRIKDGVNPLDCTAVHPESYGVVEKMAQHLGITVAEIIGNAQMLERLEIRDFADEKTGTYTLHDIQDELLKPGRDPRSEFVVPSFREDVKEVSDLQEGMELEGTVTNVTNFGAFVDIGVHQDGLVHVSELSNRFVQDPREAVHVGQIVKVKVIGVDKEMKRISLSIKALLPKLKKPKSKKFRKGPRKPQSQPAENTAPAVAKAPPESATSMQLTPLKKPEDRKPAGFPPRPKPGNRGVEKGAPVGNQRSMPVPPQKEKAPAPLNLTMAEKIRLLQERFGSHH